MKLTTAFLTTGMFLLAGCTNKPTITTASPKALQYYKEGVSLFGNFYYSEALAAYQNALKEDSTFAMAWGRIAQLNMYSGNEQAAKNTIGNALRYAPGITDREQLILRLWNHQVHFEQSQALAVADSILDRYPDEKEVYVTKGRILESQKGLDRAIQSYQKAIEIDSSYAQAVMSLGYAFSTAGDQRKAIEQMQRYIRLVPDAADPRASYADLLFRAGEYDNALEQYRKSLEIKPDYWYAHTMIGRIYAVLGRLHDAEEELLQGLTVVEEGPKRQAQRLAIRGSLEVLRGEYAKAVAAFREAVQMDSSNYFAAYGGFEALSKLGQFDDANAVIDRLRLELERKNLSNSVGMLDFYLMRARVWIDEGELDRAEILCDSALAFSTPLTRTAVFRELAEINLRKKDIEAAFMACDEALRLNPNQPDVLLVLVKLYNANHDATMREEIGKRLLNLWKDADPDFQKLKDLRSVLRGKPLSIRAKSLESCRQPAVVNRMTFMYLDPAFFALSSKGPSSYKI